MLLILVLFALFAVTTVGGVALARASSDSVHANSSTVGVLACILAVSAAALLFTSMASASVL
ncbi:MAG TPA: hypothetical protein PK781_03095 [Terrimesophilobacter sp.]|nr:hypothetical protein [Terrimesophilobacter sp.]HRP99432.1 hypothetical protein [Terrimesophilobacter sp.]